MTEETKIDRPKELEDLANIFHRTTNYVDEHLQQFRYGIYAICLTGGVLTIRGLRVFTRFKSAKDVPKSYIKKNMTLHGKVRRVDPETRALLVEHEPWVSLWRSNSRANTLLPVTMGGVRTTALAYQWLDLTMRNKNIDFTLLRSNPNNQVECIVKSTEGMLNNRCLNSEAVKLGFGQVADVDQRLSNNKMYMKFYRQLLHMEAKALSDRNGVWSTVAPATKSRAVFEALWKFMKNIVKLTSKLKSRGSTSALKAAT